MLPGHRTLACEEPDAARSFFGFYSLIYLKVNQEEEEDGLTLEVFFPNVLQEGKLSRQVWQSVRPTANLSGLFYLWFG